jgi:hypothetical protein
MRAKSIEEWLKEKRSKELLVSLKKQRSIKGNHNIFKYLEDCTVKVLNLLLQLKGVKCIPTGGSYKNACWTPDWKKFLGRAVNTWKGHPGRW